MEAYELCRIMRDGYPFIYRTRTNEYYFIGCCVFRKCSQEEKELYNSYLSEMDRIKNLNRTAERQDVKNIVNIFNEILLRGDVPFESEKERLCSNKLLEYLQNLNEKEISILNEQHRDFVEACDYKEGLFYRHIK